jgi:two-component system cell cycle sensor histidine kinase/response regulator CckA
MLEEFGFNVFTAGDGEDTIRMFHEHDETIDLVILDASMPHKGGMDAFMELRKLRPDVKVMLSSGLPETGMADKRLDGFIQKPFTHERLRRVVTEILYRQKTVL